MATEILMPQMGESIAEGTITRWLVQLGDRVERDQTLLEISTDKVDADIPSPASGVVVAIHRQEGETVPVHQVVGLIASDDEVAASAAASASASAASAAASAAAAPAETAPLAAGTASAAADGELPDVELDDDAEVAAEGEESANGLSLEERIRRFSSPLVRSMAEKESVDLNQVAGTGIHGRVTKKDMLAYLEARERGEVPVAPVVAAPVAAAPVAVAAPVAPVAAAPVAAAPVATPVAAAPVATPAAAAPVASTPAASAPAPAAAAPAGGFHIPAYFPGENVVIEPMSRIRQITAQHMAYSKATSAHVTTVFHIDMTRIARLRDKVKDRFAREAGTKLTFMPFIFRAVCNGLQKYPQLNAAIDGTNIVYKKDINLGMAVSMPNGLIVPVIKKADEKSLVGLARGANDLAERARTRKLKPEDVQAGTFTITNPGVFGSLFGTPVINQPQVAILGIGTIEKRPIVMTDEDGNDAIAIRTMAYFAITFDHRLIDGADADHFMVALKATLENDEWGELAPYLG